MVRGACTKLLCTGYHTPSIRHRDAYVPPYRKQGAAVLTSGRTDITPNLSKSGSRIPSEKESDIALGLWMNTSLDGQALEWSEVVEMKLKVQVSNGKELNVNIGFAKPLIMISVCSPPIIPSEYQGTAL